MFVSLLGSRKHVCRNKYMGVLGEGKSENIAATMDDYWMIVNIAVEGHQTFAKHLCVTRCGLYKPL